MGGNNVKVRKSVFFVGLIVSMFLVCMPAKAEYSKPEKAPFVISNIHTNKTEIKEGEYFEYTIEIIPHKKDLQWLMQEKGKQNRKQNVKNARLDGIRLVWDNRRNMDSISYWFKEYRSELLRWNGKQKYKISGKFKIERGTVSDKFKLRDIGMEYSYQFVDKNGIKRKERDEEWFRLENVAKESKLKKVQRAATFKTIVQKEDRDAPRCIGNDLTISTNVVIGDQKAKLSAKVTDESGVKSVTAIWEMIGRDSKDTIMKEVPMKYNRDTDRYECYVGVSQKYKKARFHDMNFVDVHGNWNTLIFVDKNGVYRKGRKELRKYDIIRK